MGGIAKSAMPYRCRAPAWLKIKPEEVMEQITKMAKKGVLPSQIGVSLRDSFGVPKAKAATGNKILRILKLQGLAPTIPEDLYHLIKKGVQMHKHMEKRRRTKIRSSSWCLLSRVFTALPGITAARSSFRPTGSTAPVPPRPWWRRWARSYAAGSFF